MIPLALNQAVACYVALFIVLFVGGTVFSLFLRQKEPPVDREYHLWQCSICMFVYLIVFDQKMTVCPQCGSYNKKEVEA
jgi:hypothetical protein